MSKIKKGALCIIIGGCPENIGMLVEVVAHLGRHDGREDAYEIKTITGRKFNQMWRGTSLVKGFSTVAITDRHKLRPLEDGESSNSELLVEDKEALFNT